MFRPFLSSFRVQGGAAAVDVAVAVQTAHVTLDVGIDQNNAIPSILSPSFLFRSSFR